MRKSRQNALGAVPQDPLTLKLRLDTNDALASSVQRRRYALKVPAAHFMWKLWMVRGRGGWGAGRRLAEGAVLQTIKYLLNCHLSSPPQRRGQGWWFALPRSSAGAIKMRPRLPLERICAQYRFGFFVQEKSKSVASTAKRQRGLQRGKLGSPLPCFASFCRSKRKAPAG